MRELNDLVVMSYCLNENKRVFLDLKTLPSNPVEKWAIVMDGFCLDREGYFIYEPLPSNRDEDFLSETRWDSAEEALEFWERFIRSHNI